MVKMKKIWRYYQIISAGQSKTPITRFKPPLGKKEKEIYYEVMEYAERIRKEQGREPMFYIPDDLDDDINDEGIYCCYDDDEETVSQEELNSRIGRNIRAKSQKRHKNSKARKRGRAR